MSDLPEVILNILLEDSDEKTPVQIANEIADVAEKHFKDKHCEAVDSIGMGGETVLIERYKIKKAIRESK